MNTNTVCVRDYMHPVEHYFERDTSIEQVVKTISKNHIVGGPVVDAEKRLIGFITEQDCIKQMLNNTYYCESHDVASDIMRSNPLSISPDTDILELADKMSKKGPKIYPVIEDEKLLGIISRADVLKALSLTKKSFCSATA